MIFFLTEKKLITSILKTPLIIINGNNFFCQLFLEDSDQDPNRLEARNQTYKGVHLRVLEFVHSMRHRRIPWQSPSGWTISVLGCRILTLLGAPSLQVAKICVKPTVPLDGKTTPYYPLHLCPLAPLRVLRWARETMNTPSCNQKKTSSAFRVLFFDDWLRNWLDWSRV